MINKRTWQWHCSVSGTLLIRPFWGDFISLVLVQAQLVARTRGALHLLAGFAVGLAHFVVNFSSAIPAVGASGTIAGVIEASTMRRVRRRMA